MSDSGRDSDSPLSQFSLDDDEIVWSLSDSDYIVLSLPSPLSDSGSDDDLSAALDKLSLSSSTDPVPDVPRRARSSSATSASSEYHTGANTPIASYDDASAFITRFISSPVEGNDAQLNLLRALIIELGLRSPNASDFPCTLTSARKMLKAEAHVNIKEYVMTRDKGQSALRKILKPSRTALRKDVARRKKASLRWVKQHGLQVLLVACVA